MSTRLVAGLGNPGKAYAGTRHNAGFLVVEELARRSGTGWQKESARHAEVARQPWGWLAKPTTFMNDSGRAIQSLAAYYRIQPAEILAVFDDFALPLGQVRLRKSGSSGGHNGLKSLCLHLGTSEIPRLRIGIGSPNRPTHDYVLDTFAPEELPVLERAVIRAADCVEAILTTGLEPAMNQFNSNLQPEP
ncbi:MAG TPA: aminoacyl-tRNA hydrolase [Chthoniobacterales bacterium]